MEKEIEEKLNELIAKSFCVKEVYDWAKEMTTSQGVSDYFKEKSEERKKFSKDLIKIIYAMGGRFEEDKNLTENNSGNIRSPLLSGDLNDISDQSLLNETIKANREITGEYETLLTQFQLPQEQASILKEQLAETERIASENKFADDI